MVHQDGLYREANKTTSEALKGTHQSQQKKPKVEAPSTSRDQQWHDSAFKIARGNVKGRGHLDPKRDRDAARDVLKIGGHPGKLQNSVANHSPYLQREHKNDPVAAHKKAGQIVASAYKKNLDNTPRDPRQNVKPGHETHRGQSMPSSSKTQAKSHSQQAAKPSTSAQMAAYQHHSQTRSR